MMSIDRKGVNYYLKQLVNLWVFSSYLTLTYCISWGILGLFDAKFLPISLKVRK